MSLCKYLVHLRPDVQYHHLVPLILHCCSSIIYVRYHVACVLLIGQKTVEVLRDNLFFKLNAPMPWSADSWPQVLAKDLVRTRNYVTKFIEFRSHLQGVGLKLETVRSHEAMAGAMKDVTKAMVSLNKQVSAESDIFMRVQT